MEMRSGLHFAAKLKALVLTSGALAFPAMAQDGAGPSDRASRSSWEFNLIPYVWTAGASGRLGHRGLPVEVDVDASFSDIFRRLDVGAMVAFEGRRGKWGFVADFLTISLSDDEARLPLVGLPLGVRTNTTTLLGGAQYRVVDHEAVSLDLTAGLRVWSVSTRFDFAIPDPIPLPPELGIPRTYSARERAAWLDAMAGVKTSIALAPNIHLNGAAMIGGGSSKFSSDLYGSLGIHLSRQTSLLLGYRHFTTDFESDGGFTVDLGLRGPLIGLGIRF
jgi:hypothetical protein